MVVTCIFLFSISNNDVFNNNKIKIKIGFLKHTLFKKSFMILNSFYETGMLIIFANIITISQLQSELEIQF